MSLKSFLASTLLVAAFFQPTNLMAQSGVCDDPDGDGYGWNGERACRTRRVRKPFTDQELSVLSSTASNITSNSTDIDVTLNQVGSTLLKFGKTSSSLLQSAPYKGHTRSTTHTHSLTGLEENTTYFYKVFARTRGLRVQSDIKTFKTLPSNSVSTTTSTTSTSTTSTTTSSTTTSTVTTKPPKPGAFYGPIREDGKLLAFPGAQGFARFTNHARGCQVVLLNTLEDDRTPNNGKVSFYEAMTMKGCRYIIPTVGGVIDLKEKEVKLFRDQAQNVYFAGQAAPAPGLVVTSRLVNIGDFARDFMLRHVTFRGPSTSSPTRAANSRALTVSGGDVENIMIDHISASWATDETTSIYLGPGETGDLNKISWTNSIMAEGDAASLHPESVEKSKDGLHATGASCMNNNTSHTMKEVSFIGNLIVDQNQRLPVINGCHAEIYDNYMANWRWAAIKVRTQTTEASAYISNNMFAPGDQSPTKAPYYKFYKDNSSKSPIGRIGCNQDCTIQLWFQRFTLGVEIGDNYFWPRNEPWSEVYVLDDHPHVEALSRDPQIQSSYSPTTPAPQLWAPNSNKWKSVGHTVPVRDEIDKRIIGETLTRTNILGIDDYNRMSGNTGTTPESKRDFSSYSSTKWPSDYDSDKDGMSDAWEDSVGLDSSDGTDHANDRDGDGLTNIEEFLSILAKD